MNFRAHFAYLVFITLMVSNYIASAQCTSTITNFQYEESFELNLGDWSGNTSLNNPPANGTWGIRSGGTPSNFTGPTSSTVGNNYIYTEASGATPGSTIYLNSPCFQIPGGTLPSFSFDYHMWADPANTSATAMGSLSLEINPSATGGTWSTLWTVSENQGNNWNSQLINLTTYAGQTIRLRFKAIFGTGSFSYAGDRALDNLRLSLGLDVNDTYCQGGNHGSITTNPVGLTTPLTYAWNTGATTPNINNLTAGTYTVTITDALSVSQVLSAIVPDGAVPIVNGNGYTEGFESNDFGDWFNDSIIDDFDWTVWTGNTPTNFTGPNGASEGTYYSYTEASGRNAQDEAYLVSPCFDLTGLQMPYFKFRYNQYVANGAAAVVGNMYLTADTTPQTPFTCDTIWSKIGATGTAWVQDSVDLTDYINSHTTLRFIGQIGTTNVQFGDRALDFFEIKEGIQITNACDGTSGGAISVSPMFGTPPYSYSWNTGASGSGISGLSSGTYTVTVTDNSSQSQVYTAIVDTAYIVTPTGLNASVTEFCANQLQTVTLNIDYINGDAIFNSSTSVDGDYGPSNTVGAANDFIITGTPALATGNGNLTIYYRGDMEAPGEFVRNYSENGSLIGQTLPASGQCNPNFSNTSFVISVDSLNYWAANDTILFHGEPSGMTRYCNAGAGQFFSWQAYYNLSYPYTTIVPYWFEGSCDTGVSNSIGSGFFIDVNPTATTTYFVRYYDPYCDAWGDCQSITITVDSVPQINITPAQASYCNNPVSLSASGAVSYNWIPGTGLNSSNTASVLASPANTITYNVVGTDANGCFDTTQVTVTQVPPLNASVTVNSNASCFGASDGGATANATLGSGSYSYVWSTGQTTQSISGLAAGTYQVSVSDTVGCIDVVSFTITQPAQVGVIFSSNDPCNGSNNGTITAIPTGGINPYTYSWSNGQTSATATGLLAGTYTVTVTDNNGCIGIGTNTISNSALTVTLTQTPVSCFGGNNGSITANPSGGSAPYFYNWLNSSFSSIGQFSQTASNLTAGQYFVQVSSSNGCNVFSGSLVTQPTTAVSVNITSSSNVTCNGGSDGSATATTSGGTGSIYTYLWSTGATTATITGLTAGTYVVSSTDGNGCLDTASVTIVQPTPITGLTSSTPTSCFGLNDGTATASGSGGSGSGYSYLWSNGQTSQTATGLSAGTYNVTITDGNGCTGITSVIVLDATPITSTITAVNAQCNGASTGTLTVNASGGAGGFTYNWSNGQTSQTATNLSAGSYSVTITDANGCTSTNSGTISEPSALVVNASVILNVLCFGQSTGEGLASASGGTGTISYLWSNGASGVSLINVPAGTYTVTATDNNGCTNTAQITINQPATALSALATTIQNVTCNGGNDGQASVSASGGTPSYTYLWSNGGASTTATGLTAGSHTVTITDANGCTTTASVTITEPTLLVASVTADSNVSCNGGNDGGLSASASGGTSPYTYAWSNGASTASITGLAAGSYNVTITDANGCIATAIGSVTEPAALTATVSVNNNVSCNGGADGSLSASVTGGTASYIYSWSNGATSATITGLAAGTYTVTITDANGCTSSASNNITEPTVLIASVTTDSNVSCNGGADGGLSASVTGGTASYIYSWSNGASTASITGVAAGTYNVTITDANGCTATASGSITEPTALSASALVLQNVTCNGGNDGQASVSASGGTPSYTYLWSNGGASTTATGLTAGSHTVTITDANGCVTTASVTITEPTLLVASVTTDSNVSCNGGNDGGLSASATGGTTSYTYAWSNGATTASITGLATGSYNVTITDANGCTATATGSVTEPAVLAAAVSVNNNVSCNGGADGSLSASATGGTTSYTYAWSNGATSATITGLAAGTYTVTITDANGCVSSASNTITEPTALAATISVDSNVSCNGGADGGPASVTGGTASYIYSWSNGASTASITGVAAGTYNVTITDANGCTASASGSITEPTALSASTLVLQNVTCNGGNDGQASVSASGGTPSYTYLWSNGGASTTATGLTAGSHTVTITDANGCTTTASVTITEPTLLVASVTTDSNVSCNGGNDGGLSASATGGTTSYTYAWSNGATTASITGLATGSYNVTITDANGCTATATGSVTEPAALAAAVSVNNNVSCNGGADGSLSASATGGTTSYTYAWSNGATSATITGLAAGTYTVTITDANGCTSSASNNITEPTVLVASVTTDSNVSCNGGADGGLTASATGGTTSYNYAWSNGATTASITGVAAGTYNVTITDANGCTATASGSITEPTALSASTTVLQNVSCNGGNDGQASVSASGGTPSYSYLWSNVATTTTATGLTAGAHTVTITDANGCVTTASVSITEPTLLVASVTADSNVSCNGGNDGGLSASASGGTSPYTYAWSNGASTASITGLAAGSYNVTITDANGCTATATGSVTEPAVLTAAVLVNNNVSCNGGADGSLSASATGGTTSYTYAWSNGATSATITGLAAGTYTVTITDANGCTSSASNNITEPTVLVASVTTDSNVSCNGGADGGLTASATGGTTSYNYAWSNGATTASITGVAAGSYNVTITDANGCTATASGSITEPTALSASTTVLQNVSCNGGNDGQASVSASGGTPSYTYLWSNGGASTTATGLTAGSHTVTITDANGCVTTASVSISEPTLLVASVTADSNVSCNGGNDGGLSASASGGTSPYTYAWSNGASTASITGLAAGSYNVTITDANGCIATAIASVTEPAVLIAAITIDSNASCNGGNDGGLTATQTGGTSNYSYLWSNGATTASISGLAAGNYDVTITDANGCTASNSEIVTEPIALANSVSLITNVSCNAGNDGSAFASANGGTSPYQYVWSNGETNDTAFALTAGLAVVTITDANGCTQIGNISISEPASLIASIALNNNVSCFGGSNASATATAVGGTANYSFLWSNGESNNTAIALSAGLNIVTVTDANGCTDTSSINITQPDSLNAVASIDSNVSCFGTATGGSSAMVIGGTLPYAYTWSNSATTASIGGLTAGTYLLTVTDALGCTDTSSIFISEPSALALSMQLVNNVSCNSGNDGNAYVAASGGTITYSYAWSNGSIDSNANALSAGTYYVTVTDQNGCITSDSIAISEPTSIVSSTSVINNVSCFGGNDGSAVVTSTGGTGTHTYQWSNAVANDTTIGLSAGTYYVTITDANNCSSIDSVLITEPATTISTATSVVNNVLCFGDTNATATVVANGGTFGYTYVWSNATIGDTALLSAGIWYVTATDANGCIAVDSVLIIEPTILVASISNITNITCNGQLDGAISVSETGGTANYTYLWNNGMTNPSINGLDSGIYVVTVTDQNGCTDTASASILEPDTISNTFTIVNASCNGSSTGAITANPAGGTGAYTYLWSQSGNTSTITGLSAGSYSVIIEDINGCNNTFSAIVNEPSILLANTTVLANELCNGDSIGLATVSATGGTAPYAYAWPSIYYASNDSVFGLAAGITTVTVTDANGCSTTADVAITEPDTIEITASSLQAANCFGGNDGSITVSSIGGTSGYSYAWNNGATGATITGLMAGTYCVTATDANGCTNSTCFTIGETNPLPIVNLGNDFNSCNLSETIDAGTFTSYAWSTGSTSQTISVTTAGIFSVTVTDNNGCQNSDQILVGFFPHLNYSVDTDSSSCGQSNGAAHITALTGGGGYQINWSTSQNGGLNLNNLSAGSYSVNVSDQNGCSLSENFEINDIQSIQLAVSAVAVSCANGNDGSASATVISGGTAPFTYNWSNGSTTATITGLTAGNYHVTVTGANGCQTLAMATVQNALPITLALGSINATCNDSNGLAFINTISPAGNYTYLWNDYLAQTTDTASALPAGSYSLTVTNDAGCSKNASIIINDSAGASISMTAVNENCENSGTGAASVSIVSGFGPYSYLWNDPSSQSTASALGLGNGTYMVTVTDGNGCISINSAIVGFDYTSPTISLGSDTMVCANSYSLSPGIGYNSYNWSNGSTNTTISASTSGLYIVSVTDVNGCQGIDSINLTLNAPISYTSSVTNSNCASNDGSIVLNVLSGGGSYVFNWSNGDTSSSISNIGNGTYDVTLTDANGCVVENSFTIIQTSAPTLSAQVSNPICNGSSDGSIAVSTAGGTAPFSFNWNTGSTIDTLINLSAGTYFVTVTDANGCEVISNYTLSEPQPIDIIFSISQSTCGNNNGSAVALVSNGQGTLNYIWNDLNNTTIDTLSNVLSGTYSITVSDSAGCTAQSSAVINDLNAALIACGSLDNNCDNESSGVAYAIVTGVAPFTYNWNTGASTDSVFNLANGIYHLTVTDGNGCNTITSTSVSSFYVAPSISLGADINACEGSEVILTPGGGFSSYTWSNGETANHINVANSNAYSVTVVDVNGCSAFDTTLVNLVAPPIVDLGADTLVCLDDEGASLTLDATENFTNYNWSDGSNTSTIAVTQTGIYSVTVDNGDQCFGTDAIIVVFDSCININVGEDELFGHFNPTISLYPNPSRGAFVLETKGLKTGSYLIQIRTVSGQVVERKSLNITAGLDSRDEFNLSHVARGVYIVTIEGQELILDKRIIIQ